MSSFESFLKSASKVKPSKRQLDWFNTEFYAFIHFGINTFTNSEWGSGKESPKIFNPKELNCDQWVEAIKSAGAKGLVLTAKHHDGFCLWPSKYTEHSVKNSPYKNGNGNIVLEASLACKKAGIKFGVYLSPWDRNSKLYGTKAYNDYYANQLTELLTEYGEIFIVWQDNACGEGENGIKQTYDFERFNKLVRLHQPNAVIFNDYGPDVRWCGNESGKSRSAEWAVVPSELAFKAKKQTKGPVIKNGNIKGQYNWDVGIGSLANIIYSKGLVFAGSEIDFSIRPGWFYHENEKPHSLNRLWNTYLDSVGNNACFNLNVPPMSNGLLNAKDIVRLNQFGNKLKKEFSNELPVKFNKTKQWGNGQCEFVVKVDNKNNKPIKYIVLQEDIKKGQRVEQFILTTKNHIDGKLFNGYCIGHKKICSIDNINTNSFKILITATRNKVLLKSVKVFA